ncbi:hypothetical protein PCK1_002596 [Pneumocystis canis]|nr:hypothetical protein PCK1_002596 [Pneumocystis canis]
MILPTELEKAKKGFNQQQKVYNKFKKRVEKTVKDINLVLLFVTKNVTISKTNSVSNAIS